jgi:transposase
MDSSVIDLCLKIFPWAKYQTTKGALKLHTILDLNKGLPVFLNVTEGKASDIKTAKEIDLPISSDSIFVFDRGYVDYEWYRKLTEKNITFVTRVRSNMAYEVLGQHSNPSIASILKDEEIKFSKEQGSERYPEKLRLVTYYDKEKERITVYLTNNFKFAASTIADIYKSRWKIETFFRWIKQNLKIKTFLGTSKNAVMFQIYAAMIYYVLLKYLSFQWNFNSTTELSRRIQACLWKKNGLDIILSRKLKIHPKPSDYAVQLTLF